MQRKMYSSTNFPLQGLWQWMVISVTVVFDLNVVTSYLQHEINSRYNLFVSIKYITAAAACKTHTHDQLLCEFRVEEIDRQTKQAVSSVSVLLLFILVNRAVRERRREKGKMGHIHFHFFWPFLFAPSKV